MSGTKSVETRSEAKASTCPFQSVPVVFRDTPEGLPPVASRNANVRFAQVLDAPSSLLFVWDDQNIFASK